jgi:ppGpp synthetase/RelA/SpoT-type nucleotidyltranferase
MITCNSCGKRLSESCYYGATQWKNGKQYINYYHVCKKCLSLKAKAKNDLFKMEKEETPEEEVPATVKSYSWVLRNLQRFGNCYIKHLNKINLKELSIKLGFALRVRPTSKENKGYIIERVNA